MSKYIRQGFLFDCPYAQVPIPVFTGNLTDVQDYKIERNLFDDQIFGFYRSISLSELDTVIDTYDDLKKVINMAYDTDALVIIDDRPAIALPQLANYAEATLKAYLWHFQDQGIVCYVSQFNLGSCNRIS